jgi:hypothetical protein
VLITFASLGLFSSTAKAQTLSINDKSVTEKTGVPNSINFTVALSRTSAQDVFVHYDTVDVTATAAPTAPATSDYTAQVDQIATIAAGSSSTTISIPINADSVDEINDNETFNVILSNAVNATIADGTGVGTIIDDDVAQLSVSDTSFDEGNAGQKPASFSVTLSNVCDHAISFNYSLADGTATVADPDYLAASGSITWPADTAGPIKIDIGLIGDTIYEADETLFCNISNPSGVTILDAQGIGTIKNDDAAPSINIGNATLDPEGNSGTKNLNFPVTLSSAVNLDVTVQYDTADGTASSVISPIDYITQTAKTLTIPAGQTSTTISVPVVGDLLNEIDEKFTVKLSNPVNATIPMNGGTATGIIVNDDAMPTISISDLTVTEGTGSSTDAIFTVTLSAASGQTVSANFSMSDGTANNPTDYQGFTGTVTFPPGQTTKTITVKVVGDDIDEADETFQLTLGTPTNAIAGKLVSDATIVDDDNSTLSVADSSVTEGNSGTKNLAFIVTLSAPSSQTVTVNFTTADGTAIASADYSAKSGKLTFAPGETSKTVNVVIIGDTVDEGNETLFLKLTNPVNAPIVDSTAIGTIVDNDQVLITIDNQSVTEGDSGTTQMTFTVKLSAISDKTISVNYATQANTARPPGDYTTQSGTLTFGKGETTKTVVIDVLGDTIDEVNETFNVNLTAPVNAVISDNQGVGTILDDDALPSLSIADVETTEGNSGTKNLTFKVVLSSPSGKTVTVNYASADIAAKAGFDYTAVSGTLTFTPGAVTRTLVVPILSDVLDENDETFKVTLKSPVNATIADSLALGTILDDDATPSLSINDATVLEGDAGTVPATFTVTLSAVSGRTVTTKYALQSNTAKASSDFMSTSSTLTFAAGETTKTITVLVNGDTVDEIDETFFVNLSNQVNALVAKPQGVGTINDDDLPPALSISDVTVKEGNSGTVSANFIVTLSAVSGKSITMNYATADGQAKAGSDYVAATGSLTFTPGQTSKIIPIKVKGDTIGETDEKFVVNLSNVVNATVSDAQGIGTIDEDDSVSQVTLSSALADASGSSVTLNFTGPMSADAQDLNNYAVTVNGTPLQIQRVSVSQTSDSVILLWPPKTIPVGATVVVTWQLTDALGLDFDSTTTLIAQ